MSYGVIASRAAQVQVDRVRPTDPSDAPPSQGRRRARPKAEPALWGSGRLTLTSLHLTFVPASGSSGVRALTLALADIVAIESSGGRGHKVIAFRTGAVVVRARLTGASSFARQVAASVESNRKRSAAHPLPLESDDFPLSSG